MIGIGIGVRTQKVGGYGLAKPVATAATGVGQTSFTANWNAYTGAVVYLLDVSTSPTFDTFIYENQQVNAPSTSYVVIGLEPNTTYYYRVRASTEALTDPDAQAFFIRVTDAGGTLSTTEQDAVNTLVVQMKADGIWSKMKAIYPMVGASAAACAQNLKSSSFTGTFTPGWTFASNGVTPNGTSAFMDTTLNPQSELSINSSHMSSYVNTTPNNGMLLGNGALSCFHQYASNILYGGLANGSFIQTLTTQEASFTMVNRPSSSTINLYKNNSKLAENTSNNGSSYASGNITIAKYGNSFFQDARFAFASIGDGLTDTEASDFYTAVQAFQTTLSRNV